ALTGWSVSPSAVVGGNVWRAIQLSTVVAPSQTLSGPVVWSNSLPGVSRITVFPAVGLSAWDEPSPAGRQYVVIAPVIGTLEREPVSAGSELLHQIRANLIPALVADRDRSTRSVD